jgi:hypothetical protein
MKNAITALGSTFSEVLDSKKWIGSYVAAIFAAVLHLYFGVSIENALLLASPISLAVLSQAHVDASAAKGKTPSAVGQLIEAPNAGTTSTTTTTSTPSSFETETPVPK